GAGHLGNVGARCESAVAASHDHRAHSVVAVELLERRAQRVHGGTVQGVELLGPIEAHQGGALLRLPLDEDERLVGIFCHLVTHGPLTSSSQECWWRAAAIC